MKKLLLLIPLLAAQLCLAQTKPQIDLGYQLICDFYRNKPEKNRMVTDFICDERSKTELKNILTPYYLRELMFHPIAYRGFKLEKYVSEKDLSYMRSKVDEVNLCKPDPSLMNKSLRKRLIAEDELKKLQPWKISVSGDYLFFPVFNERMDLAVLYTANYCGVECSSTHVYFFKLKKHRWKLLFGSVVSMS